MTGMPGSDLRIRRVCYRPRRGPASAQGLACLPLSRGRLHGDSQALLRSEVVSRLLESLWCVSRLPASHKQYSPPPVLGDTPDGATWTAHFLGHQAELVHAGFGDCCWRVESSLAHLSAVSHYLEPSRGPERGDLGALGFNPNSTCQLIKHFWHFDFLIFKIGM